MEHIRHILLATLLCALVLSLGCQKAAPDQPLTGSGGDTAADDAAIEQGLDNAAAIEEELAPGEDLDEDFIGGLDW